MAPEQAEGKTQEISTAADIYSLGAILYELLTRRPPFQGETFLATLEQVRTQEPVPPHRIRAMVPRDLETICLKCLHKDPSRRYRSGAALADDLRRFLSGEPILARRTGTWERSVKWARRRPALAALVGVVGLAVLGLVLGSFWHNAQLQDALDTAEDREQEAQRQRKRAEENFRRAEDRKQEAQGQRKRAEANFRKAFNAVHQMLTRVSEAKLPNVPGSEHLRRALLEDALRLNQELLHEKSNDPPLRRETGRVFRQLADVYHNLGQQDQAEKAYGKSLALYQGLVAEFPNRSEYQEELAETQNNLAILFVDTGRPDHARKAYEQALKLRKALTERFPNEPKHRQQQAILQCNMGQLLYRTGHLDEAERIYREAADLQQNLANRFPSKPFYRYAWSWALMNRGVVLATTGQPTAAHQCYQEALPMLEKLAHDSPRVAGYRYELAGLHNNLALLFQANRCLAESEAPCRTALALQGKLVADFPKVLDYQRALAGSYQNLTGILMDLKRLPEAEKAALQALTLRQRLAAAFPKVPDYESDLGATLGALGSIAQAQGKLAEARERLAQAAIHHCNAVNRNPRHMTYRQFMHRDYQNLAEVLLKLGEHAEAVKVAVALPQILPGKWQDHRRAASILAGCIPLAEKDHRLAPAKRQALARSYGAKALVQLREAITRGFTDTGDLKRDTTLTPLRNLEGFQKLLSLLETKAPVLSGW
jgi:tetratricopeptide (TPR) repeat protein